MLESKGQKVEEWLSFWHGLTPKSEIQMWDYYGGRPWILKYSPRFGKVCEAGCGLGRYVFYLSRLGVDIEGLDFEKQTIDYLNNWKIKNGFIDVRFILSDVTQLPYEDNSLSGYISLGVVEHFVEGPQKTLEEAYRILRPGGIAIVTTPSISWYLFYRHYLKKPIKNFVKRLIGKKIVKPVFFQYWYRPKKLRDFVENARLKVTSYAGADLLFPFLELSKKSYRIRHWHDKSFPVRFANKFEGTFLANLGAQSVTISVKVAETMHCFLCGKLSAKKSSLDKYDVPICPTCSNNKLVKYYKKGIKPKYHSFYKIHPPVQQVRKEVCEFTNEEYLSDKLFENHGFTRKVNPKLLNKIDVSIELSNNSIQHIFRERKNSQRNK